MLVVAFGLFLTSCQKTPEACFEATSTEAVAGRFITFLNCSRDADTYLWEFGDGTTSSTKTPTKTYTQNGIYTVRLTAYSKNGNKKDEFTQTITIGEKHITKVELVKIDFLNENGFQWDPDSSGPDVAFYFGPDSIPPNSYQTDTLWDIEPTDLPIVWEFDDSENIIVGDDFWFWQLHDINTVGVSDVMGSWKFNGKIKVENPIEVVHVLNNRWQINLHYDIR